MKGYVGKWILTLIMFGMFSLFYIALNEAYNPLYTWASGAITDSDSSNSVSILNVIWMWFPIAVLFSYFVYSIIKPSREREVWP